MSSRAGISPFSLAPGKLPVFFPVSVLFLAGHLCFVNAFADEAVRVRVPNALSNDVRIAGASVLATYDSFSVLELMPAAHHVTNFPGVEVQPGAHRLFLRKRVLDTRLAAAPASAQPAPASAVPAGKRLTLVQFIGPPKPEWLEALTETGLRVVSYVPENGYLVFGDHDAQQRLSTLAMTSTFIQWQGALELADKQGALPATAEKMAAQSGPEKYALQLVNDPGENAATLQAIEAVRKGPIQRQTEVLNYLHVIVDLLPSDATAIASRPDVISVQPYVVPRKFCERQAQIVAGNLSGTKPSGPGYLDWLASKGFTQAQFDASGFVVDVADSGIDDGSVTPNHYALYVNGTLGGRSRVLYNRLEGFPNFNSTLAGCDGHGTLNAHIIGGYDNRTAYPFADVSGFRFGLGICPFVNLGSSVIFDPDDFTNPSFKDMSSRAYNSGARISNHSWGGSPSGDYDIDAVEFDSLTRDAQPAGSAFSAPGNQEMVFVVAAGNHGPDLQTVSSPAAAKNVIAVGAGEGVQPIGGIDSSNVGDLQANNASDMINFSGRGPCADGRHKPDIVAPGTHISGGVYQRSSPGTFGTAASCYDGTGVSGGANNNKYFPSGQQFFTASSGTSHSAPAVAGGAALLRQWFINHGMLPPSPAMTKAYLMNSARYMTGAAANDTLWSDGQGMGALNLGMAFDQVPRVTRDQEDLFTASGQTTVFTGAIPDPSRPFRVTLAWTDAPGSTLGNAYNNNLDLVVTVNGAIYKGNHFNGQWSALNGQADARNNAESVVLPPGVGTSFSVQVIGTSINSDGVPQNSTALDQDFALVIYNAVLEQKPALRPLGAALVGESFSPGNQAMDPGESVIVSLKLSNIGNAATTNLTATLRPTAGVTQPGPAQVFGIVPTSGEAVERTFSFTANGVCGTPLRLILELRDGALDLGTVAYDFVLGRFQTTNTFSESFDAVTVPGLPALWSTAVAGGGRAWVSSAPVSDTPPNSLYALQSAVSGVTELVSPPVSIRSPDTKLSFRNNFDLEADDIDKTLAYDGGVLEVKIGNGEFQDILSAGGVFVLGGYSHSIDPATDSPLSGRQAWSGNSGGFVTTQVALPPSAAGQPLQLRWRLATDTGNVYGGSGWNIDTISLMDGAYSCNASPVAPTLRNLKTEQGNVSFSFETVAGQQYTIEVTDDLNAPDWAAFKSVTGTGTPATFTDSPSRGARYYRVRTP